MPAKAGEATDVPPTDARVPSLARNPAEQLVGVVAGAKKACEQISEESWFGDEVKDRSGTSRWPSTGVRAVCQVGLAKTALTPPPVAESPPPAAIDAVVSFQPISGM